MRVTLIYTLAVLAALSFTRAAAQQTAKITSNGIGYLEYLPQGYNSNTNKYPVVISLHGIKERGTTSTDPATLKASVAKVANVGLPKYVKYGQQYPFILISPQLKSSYGTWPANYVIDVVNHVKKDLRIDESRIYLTGLSLGGFGVWTTIGAYPNVFAAILPICPGGNALSKASAIAAEDVPVWGFHGDNDNVVSYTVTTKMVGAINSCPEKPNPLSKATIFPGLGHVIWDKVYKETNALDWMLTFKKGSSSGGSTTPSNAVPTVNAGTDKTITLPTNSVSLQGSASDSDGSIVSYTWSKISGGSVSLSGTTSSKLTASNLVAGTYTFRLTVKDDKGASKYDDVKVTVKSATTTNVAPVVSAGSDKTLTLPSNSIYIQGTASDSDGTIASWSWTKVSGGTASMSGTTSSKVRAYNLVAGTYVFRLTVKDNKGASKSDDVKVTVNGSSTGNTAPVANAGPNKQIYLPTNSIYIQGSGSDADGSIVSYQWSKIKGGAASLGGTTTSKLHAYNLQQGDYVFRLTVKDDKGASKYDDMLLKVYAQTTASTSSPTSVSNSLPVANAGPNIRVKQPTSSVTLNGSAYDPDGTIVAYTWVKKSGPKATLTNPNAPKTKVTGLVTGKYIYELRVKDNRGATDNDRMLLVVEKGGLANRVKVGTPVMLAVALGDELLQPKGEKYTLDPQELKDQTVDISGRKLRRIFSEVASPLESENSEG